MINALIFLVAIGLAIATIVGSVRSHRNYRGHETTKDRMHRLIVTVALLNFCAFVAVDVLVGGDALNGRVQAGHYYLGSHGSYTEVSHAVFLYSTVHAVTALVGMAAAMAAGRAWNRPSS